MGHGTGQSPETICSLTYLVNEGQLNKQLYYHGEVKMERDGSESGGGGGGGKGTRERKLIFLCFVFSLSFPSRGGSRGGMTALAHP